MEREREVCHVFGLSIIHPCFTAIHTLHFWLIRSVTVTHESHVSRCKLVWTCLGRDGSVNYFDCSPNTQLTQLLPQPRWQRQGGHRLGRESLKAPDGGESCGFDPWCDGHDGLDNPADYGHWFFSFNLLLQCAVSLLSLGVLSVLSPLQQSLGRLSLVTHIFSLCVAFVI